MTQLSRIGPFALEEPLDGPTDSHVLRGVHVERKLSVAIKLLPESVASRPMGTSTFADDVKRLQQLVHPSIVRVLGGAVSEGRPYLALELVSGESLRERLDRRGKLPWDLAVEIGDAVCQALEHAHAKGYVHLRLTPERVLLPESGGVKLTGWDCAWADRDEVLGLRSPMRVAHYLAPEVFRGKRSASLPQCDLFSLGVLLFESLTGELPWPADSPAELIEARRASAAPRVSTRVLDCPVWLDALVAQLLACKRSLRLASAEETHRAFVLAQRKAAAGTGAAQHAWSGKQGSIRVGQDREALRQLKRQPTRTEPAGPFYERAWFLAFCLLSLIGFGVWTLWPPGEEALFMAAKPLMDSESTADWKRADEQYLSKLRERFPDTKYAEEIRLFDERYAMHRAEERIKNLDRFGRKPQSEAERFFAEAWKYEQFGDRFTAWRKYEALNHLFSGSVNPDEQNYAALAKRRAGLLRSADDTEQDPASVLNRQLRRAEKLAEEGRRLDATILLRSLITLYGNNQELQALVGQARESLRHLEDDTSDDATP